MLVTSLNFNSLGKLTVKYAAIAGMAFMAYGASLAPAMAQSSVQQLQHQIKQLRGEIADLQKVVYKGAQPPTASLSLDGAGSSDRQATAQLQVQIQRLEAQRREMYGQLEELNNRMRIMETRLDKLVSDIDFRLQALEGGQPGGVATGQPGIPNGQAFGQQRQFAAPQASAQQLPNGTTIISSQGAQSPAGSTEGLAPGQQSLGQITQEDLTALQSGELVQRAAPQTASAVPQQQISTAPPAVSTVPANTAISTTEVASATPQAVLQGDTPEDQYKYAKSLLHQHDFDSAEAALRAFIDRNGEHKLAGNAMYWLGETYYARQQFEDAAAVFSDAYLRDRKATKATHSLLKLAMSLEQVGQVDSSCVAYQELLTKHADAEPRLLDRAKSARSSLGCQ